MHEQRTEILEAAYKLIEDFLSRMGVGDYIYLKEKYGVSDAVADEIKDYLTVNLNKEIAVISPPPHDIAFFPSGGRTPFAAYGDEGENFCWRVECLLWIDGCKSENTVFFDLFNKNGTFQIEYLYLGS